MAEKESTEHDFVYQGHYSFSDLDMTVRIPCNLHKFFTNSLANLLQDVYSTICMQCLNMDNVKKLLPLSDIDVDVSVVESCSDYMQEVIASGNNLDVNHYLSLLAESINEDYYYELTRKEVDELDYDTTAGSSYLLQLLYTHLKALGIDVPKRRLLGLRVEKMPLYE